MQIAASAGNYGLILSSGKPPNQITTLFLPERLSSDNLTLREKIKDEWELITLGQEIDFSAFTVPPKNWTILGIPDQNHIDKPCSTVLGWPLPHKSMQAGTSGRIIWKTVYPFNDTVRSVLITVDKTTTLVCDSSVFAYNSKNTRSPLKERVDLLIIPPANFETINEMREMFRPRFLTVIPPCGGPDTAYPKNIICVECEDNWDYQFKIKSGKFGVPEREQRIGSTK